MFRERLPLRQWLVAETRLWKRPYGFFRNALRKLKKRIRKAFAAG
jgi:hypothetical protein